MSNGTIEQTEKTHIVIPIWLKKIIDEIKQKTDIKKEAVSERALKHGLKVLYKNYLSDETLDQLNNNS
jgi:hypothetical protein